MENQGRSFPGHFGVRQALRQILSCKGGIEQTMDLSVVGEAELTDNISKQWGRVSNGQVD